jgi:hypothetical protein
MKTDQNCAAGTLRFKLEKEKGLQPCGVQPVRTDAILITAPIF